MNLMLWADMILDMTGKARKRIVKSIYDSVLIFKKGKPSKEGKEIQNLMASDDLTLIGFIPQVQYLRVDSKNKEDLTPIWEHRFSVPSLLYQVKDKPMLVIINPNARYNHNILTEIEDNNDVLEIRNLRGIIG